ncbi:hypothetical protein KM043_004011 [Ampulex compressa]|nr:hypothetical protein KM043_004011 [Ampulex compressa]
MIGPSDGREALRVPWEEPQRRETFPVAGVKPITENLVRAVRHNEHGPFSRRNSGGSAKRPVRNVGFDFKPFGDGSVKEREGWRRGWRKKAAARSSEATMRAPLRAGIGARSSALARPAGAEGWGGLDSADSGPEAPFSLAFHAPTTPLDGPDARARGCRVRACLLLSALRLAAKRVRHLLEILRSARIAGLCGPSPETPVDRDLQEGR